LTQHPVVVLMDMDMLVLKNLDDLLDVVARGNSPADLAKIGPHLQQQSSKKNRTRGSSSNTLGSVVTGGDVWLLYVSDYYLAGMNAEMFPSQGGFAVLRPNRTIYDEIRQIVLRGNFDDASGWIHRSGASTGIFWGATTFQGLLPYYFQIGTLDRYGRIGRNAFVLLPFAVNVSLLLRRSYCRSLLYVSPVTPLLARATRTTRPCARARLVLA
jgi:hypothetical protein